MTEETNLEQARKSEQNGQYFAAFHFYKNALKDALQAQDKQAILECKKKLVETGKKSQTEFKELSVEQKIPREEIEQGIEPILKGETLEKIFLNIARYQHLFPRKSAVQKSASKSMPVSYQIFGMSTLTGKGHLVADGDDPAHNWYMNMYAISQDLTMVMYLNPIFARLEEFTEKEKIFNAESVIEYFEKSAIIPREALPLISVAIRKYFEKDYVSALHIMVPQFENLFLHASEQLGIDVISINRGKGLSTNPKVLSIPLLDSEECKQHWKEDFCEQLKFVLLEPLGYKLRHKIAHGEITEAECNKTNCNLLLYLFLAVAGRIEVLNGYKSQTISVQIKRSATDVFEFTTNPANTPKWLESIVEEQVDRNPVALGAVYRNKNQEGIWTEYEVIEFEPNKLFTLKQKDSHYRVRYTYEPLAADLTKLTYHEWVERKALENPLDQEAIRKLKRVMESA